MSPLNSSQLLLLRAMTPMRGCDIFVMLIADHLIVLELNLQEQLGFRICGWGDATWTEQCAVINSFARSTSRQKWNP